MSLEIPELPFEFKWDRVKEVLLDWFYKYQKAQNTVPTGTVAAFAGTTIPDGWLECDGTEYPQNAYPELYKILGAESSPGNFKVPVALLGSPVGSVGLTATMRSSGSDTTDAISYSWASQALGPAVTNRLIVVCFIGRENSASSGLAVSSASVAGIALTKLVEYEATNEGNPNTTVTIMAATVPTGTTGTVSVTYNLSCLRAAFMLYDIPEASITPFDTEIARHTSVMSVSINVASGGAVIGVSSTAFSGCVWSGLTEDTETLVESFTAVSSAHADNLSAQTGRTVSATWASATAADSQVTAVASFQKLSSGDATWMIKV